MHLASLITSAASLAFFSLIPHIHAQADTSSRNLTLRFLPSGQDTCDYGSTSSALTFSTTSIPGLSHCFNFIDLFNSTANAGWNNETANGTTGSLYSMQNNAAFDSSANYSRVLYYQHIPNAQSDEDKPGHHADRKMTLYGGRDCSEATPSGTSAPWFGFGCWSEEKGSCGTLPYGVVSFSVQAGGEDKDGKCWVFAENGQQSQEGAAVSVHLSLQLVLTAFAGVSVAVWMGL